MRKLLMAAVAGSTLLGGAMVAQSVTAQPYGYYVAPSYHYDTYGRRYFEDDYGRHYVDDAPTYYDAPAVAGSVIGPALVEGYARVPYDRYGPDPNGMIAPDGHRIKCKLTDGYDGYRYRTRRVCD